MSTPVERWIEALRSGRYKQTRQYLQTDAGYCCLGVACELAVEAGVIRPPTIGVVDGIIGQRLYGHWSSSLPPEVRDWLGLADNSGHYGGDTTSLANRNDEGMSFEKIADLIESRPPGLFRD